MKYTEMLTAESTDLRNHYRSVRTLAYNNAKIAQQGRRTARRCAHNMGYLMRQVEMCERAANSRGISLGVIR